MRFSQFIARHHSDSATAHLELTDGTEVRVTFKYRVEPRETEDGYEYYHGGASLESVEIKPFTFNGQSHHDLLSVAGDLIWPDSISKRHQELIDDLKDEDDKKRAGRMLDMLLDELFAETVDDVDVPTRNYRGDR